MGVWSSYQARLDAKGSTKREVRLNREVKYLERKLGSTLSYHVVSINDKRQELAIINSDNLNLKTICSMPGEEIICGSLVWWSDNYWLVTEVDANDEVYTKAIMQQCNHKLKWIASDRSIVERWCIVNDGTKYLTGETVGTYGEVALTTGDTRISVSLPRDEYTVKLNRDHRFLIDDPDTETILAYRLTKPYKIGGVYNGHGVMTFVLTEVNTEDDDNFELRIADYYKHFPRNDSDSNNQSSVDVDASGKKVWL